MVLQCPVFPLEVKRALRPVLGPFPHRIVIMVNGARLDMFVDEAHMIEHDQINERATVIYRSQYHALDPTNYPAKMPTIYGPAVIFDEKLIDDDAWSRHLKIS